jgi:hypothetical protein
LDKNNYHQEITMHELITNTPRFLTTLRQRLQKTNTPQFLQLAQYIICGSSLLLFTTAVSSIQQQRQAVNIIGKDAASNVLLAQRLKDAPAGMDAYAVKALLTKSILNPANLANRQQALTNTVESLLNDDGKGKSSNASFAERRQKLAQRLLQASENISGGKTDQGERRPILTMQLATLDYLEQLQKAQDYQAVNREAESLSAYRSAVDILENSLIPAADELDKAALAKLDTAYSQQKTNVANTAVWLAMAGFAVIAQLIALQLFISLRTRRTLNIPLLLATISIGAFIIWAIVLIQTSGENLHIARENVFSSLHSLRQARSLTYTANANESRALLLKNEAARFEQAFNSNIQKIIAVPTNSLPNLAIMTAQGNTSTNIGGFLGDTLRQPFMAGEAAALGENLTMLDRYLQTSSKVRSLARSSPPAAVALASGQAGDDFNNFLKANQKAINVNKKAFDESIASSAEPLEGFESKSWTVLILIVFLVFLGLRPRIREYNFR